jgi:hypothetical protein
MPKTIRIDRARAARIATIGSAEREAFESLMHHLNAAKVGRISWQRVTDSVPEPTHPHMMMLHLHTLRAVTVGASRASRANPAKVRAKRKGQMDSRVIFSLRWSSRAPGCVLCILKKPRERAPR